MTAIEMTKTPRPGIGPFREGAGKALFYWSWFAFYAQQIHFEVFFITYRFNPIVPDMGFYSSLYFIPAIYLAGAVLFSVLGGLAKYGFASRAAKKPEPAVLFSEVYSQSFSFIKGHWKSLALISLPSMIAPILYMLPIFSLILFFEGSEESSFSHFKYIFPICMIASVFIIVISPLAILDYYHRVSESLEIRALTIIKKALVLFFLSFIIGLVIRAPFSLLQLALGNPEEYWWGLNAIFTSIHYVVNIFLFFFLVLYVIKGEGIVNTFRITARFFNAHFFKTIRFTLFLAVKFLPAAFLVLIYALWLRDIAPTLVHIGEDINSAFTVSLVEVLRWPYIFIAFRSGWIILLPIGAAAFLWLNLVFIIFIKRLDEADLAEAAESEPLPETGAKPDGRVLVNNPGV